MAPGGVEPPRTDSKFGPEPSQAETHRDDPVCEAVFCRIVAFLISAHLGGSGGPAVAPKSHHRLARPETTTVVASAADVGQLRSSVIRVRAGVRPSSGMA